MDLTSRQIKRVEDKLQLLVGSSFNREINALMKRIDKRLEAVQKDFFNILTGKIIGVTSAPQLGAYSPIWSQLTDEYTERRMQEHGIDEDQFYLATGRLETVMQKMRPTTILGRSSVVYSQQGVEKKAVEKYSKKNFLKDPTQSSKLVIDVYTKIPGSIEEVDAHDLFKGIVISEKRGRKTRKTPLAYRFGAKRPIITNYLQWWLNTRVRAAIRSEITR